MQRGEHSGDSKNRKNIKTENSDFNEINNLITVFTNAPVGMVVLGSNATIIRANAAALAYINQIEDQVLGKRFGDGFHCLEALSEEGGCGCGPACSDCRLRIAIKSAIEEGWSTSNIEISKTLLINNIEKDFWFKFSVSPVYINEKNLAVATLMDISENKRKEKNLEKARDYSINLLNQVPSMIWTANKETKCDYVNKGWIDYTGTTLEEASGYGWTSLLHPDDLTSFMNTRESTFNTMCPFQVEARIRRFDGVYHWCLLVGTPYYALDGQLSGYIGSIYDINDQKVVEEDLRNYQKIIESSHDIVFFLDFDGRIREVNKRAAETYGYSVEELRSMNISDIREGGSSVKFPETGGESGMLYEAVHRRKDGSRFQVEIRTQEADFGDKHIILKVVRDITERKLTEKKFMENQIKYRTLFMNMQTGYAYYNLVYDENHNITDLKYKEVNEAFENLFKVKKKNVLNKMHNELFDIGKDQLMKVLNMNAYKLARGESIHINEAYLQKYDLWLSFALYSPKENDLVAIITDISTMKQSERILTVAKEAAETANKAKSEFLANMSHEIRTPINGVVGMVDLTLLTELSEDARENLVTAKTCANSLLNIINDVLDFSKMEAGKLTIENVSFDIRELIEEIVKAHTPRAQEKELELNYSFSSSIPKFVAGDPNRIRQVINNLISNALKFTEEGNITVTVKKIRDFNDAVELKFIVSDTGIGIAPKDLNKLFQSFSQLEESFTKKFNGTGLGLAISKNLVEVMGGKIGVESRKGFGSTFYFNLMLSIGQSLEKKQERLPFITKTSRPLKILIAEDDVINQKVLKKMLQEKGHEAETANNGQEALELYEYGKYDVILMDIQMPVMNGVDASKKIREKEPPRCHTPIIAITAYALQGDRERFLAMGLDEYITKPIQMDVLFDILDQISAIQKEQITFFNDIIPQTNDNKLNIEDKIIKQHNIKIDQILYSISRDIEQLNEVMKCNDLLKIENLAHDIKSLAGIIDAEELKDAAFRIELAARRGNLEEALKFITDIKLEFIVYSKAKDFFY